MRIANDTPMIVIAGPCVIESRAATLAVARRLAVLSRRLRVPIVFKASFDKANRQSIDAYRGVGIAAGLEVLAEVKRRTGLPILTDVHEPWQAAPAARVADILQIPAFLSRQTDLVVAAARTGRVVAIKKGQFLSPDQVPSIIEKVRRAGRNKRSFVIERGSTFGYGDLVVDLRSIARMKRAGIPVVFDATHSVQKPGATGKGSGGTREDIPALLCGAVAVGIAGIFIETHPNPVRAKSDAATQWPLKDLESLLRRALAIDRVVKK